MDHMEGRSMDYVEGQQMDHMEWDTGLDEKRWGKARSVKEKSLGTGLQTNGQAGTKLLVVGVPAETAP